MDRNFFIKLTFGVYRVTKAFPPGEQIGEKMQDLASALLVDLLWLERDKGVVSQALHKTKELSQVLAETREKNWVEQTNFLILEQEYKKVKGFLESFAVVEVPIVKKEEGPNLSERQKKIIAILQTKEKVQVWELQKVLPEVTKRTLRRDLDELLRLNLIERQGEWNSIFYQLRRESSSTYA